jgi:hypothetical protein
MSRDNVGIVPRAYEAFNDATGVGGHVWTLRDARVADIER